MKINKEELHWLLMEWAERVADESNYNIKFTTEEIVNSICFILESNPKLINHNVKEN